MPGRNHLSFSSRVEAPYDFLNGDEGYWPSKEPAVCIKEKLRFVWWSILTVLMQLWRDLLDMHNGFASLFLADLLSHFFVSEDQNIVIQIAQADSNSLYQLVV